MRNTFFTIPNSVLTGGVIDLLTPIDLEIRVGINNEIKRIQNIILDNCGNVSALTPVKKVLENINFSLTEFKNRLTLIKTELDVEKEFDVDRSKVNQINEFLISTLNSNFEINLLVEDLLEYIAKLEEKSLALDNELISCINDNSLEIPSQAPKQFESVLVDDDMYKVNIAKILDFIINKDIKSVSEELFFEYNLLNNFFKKKQKAREYFAKRFYLTLEECNVAAFNSGINFGLSPTSLYNRLSITENTVKKYSTNIPKNLFETKNFSNVNNTISTLSVEDFLGPDNKLYKLKVVQEDRYKLASVYSGVVTDTDGNIIFKTNETFSNSPSTIIKELKFKLKYNIS